jgi:hypothetical protein
MVRPASADHQAAMAEAQRLAERRWAWVDQRPYPTWHASHGWKRRPACLPSAALARPRSNVLGKGPPDYGVDPAAIERWPVRRSPPGFRPRKPPLCTCCWRSCAAAALPTETLKLADVDPAKLRGMVMRMLTGPGGYSERRLLAPDPLTANQSASGLPHPRLSHVASRLAKMHRPPPSTGSARRRTGVCFPWRHPHVPVLYREREVGRLLDLLQAKTARVIAIVGDPGSGRSALLSALSAASLQPPVYPAGDVGAQTSAGALLQALHRRAPAQAPIVLDGSAWLGPEGGDGVLQLLACASAGPALDSLLTPADLRRIELATPISCHALETVLLPAPEPAMLREMIEVGLDALAD